MSERSTELVMMGLQASGKTTYLAGLFHALSEADDTGLSLRRYPDEREYLLGLERRWLDLVEIRHSAHVGPQSVELPIRDAQGRDIDLQMPDISGEEYRDAWENGEFSPMIAQLLQSASGLLLFVHAQDLSEPELIDLRSKEASQERPTLWKPAMGVTQARICDLLEQVVELKRGSLPPLAIVVSAWDTVEAGLTPDGWLRWRLPLLAQWLDASDLASPHKLFGISAQGGDLSDADARAQLARVPRVDRPGGAHGLMEPLQWLLDTQ